MEPAGESKAEGRTAGVWQSDLSLKSNREQVRILTSHPNCIPPDILSAARDFRGTNRRGRLAQGHTMSHGRSETRTQNTKETVGAGRAHAIPSWRVLAPQEDKETRKHP